MGLREWLGVLSPAHMVWVMASRRSVCVGQDGAGNRYFRAPPPRGSGRERRWVLYAARVPEASLVPPEWHGWLHYQTDCVPDESESLFRQPWQKPHRPNLTGTPHAFYPPGHILEGGQRPPATGDYEAWTPPEDSYTKGTSTKRTPDA